MSSCHPSACQMPIDDLQRAGWIKKEREGLARGHATRYRGCKRMRNSRRGAIAGILLLVEKKVLEVGRRRMMSDLTLFILAFSSRTGGIVKLSKPSMPQHVDKRMDDSHHGHDWVPTSSHLSTVRYPEHSQNSQYLPERRGENRE